MYLVENKHTGQSLLCSDFEVLQHLPTPTKIGEFSGYCSTLTQGKILETDQVIITPITHEHERESAAVL